jgi:hypothetical protein
MMISTEQLYRMSQDLGHLPLMDPQALHTAGIGQVEVFLKELGILGLPFTTIPD